MRISVPATALLTGALLLSLAGCAGSPAPEEGGWTPFPSTGASSGPAESPPPAGPASWAIGGGAVGPIALGGDFASTRDALPGWSSPQGCEWTATWSADGYMMYFAHPEGDDEAIDVISVSADADAIVDGVGPRTAKDLGIGSTKEDVLAAHPDAEEADAAIGDGSTWLAIEDGEDRIFFEFAADADEANAVTVTDRDEPPYEVCA